MSDQLFTTRLFLEGMEADLSDNPSIAITYVVKDINDIASAGSNYTKTITIPGTANNNKILNFYFNIQSTGPEEATFNSNAPNIGYNFNPKKRMKATIIKDNLVMFEGYAQLLDSTLTNGQISYDLQISSPLTAFANILSGNNPNNSTDPTTQNQYRLEDLPTYLTSGFTHILNEANVVNSWSAEPSTSYLYPLIDYGQDDTINTTAFYLSDLRPCLYAKQYWDMIFENAGFTYTSEFLNSEYFKHLIIPYKEGLMTGDANSVSVTTDLTTDQLLVTLSQDGAGAAISIFDDTIYDPESAYDDGTQTFTAPQSAIYNFVATFDTYFIFTPAENVPVTNTNMFFSVIPIINGSPSVNTVEQYYQYKEFGTWVGTWNTSEQSPNPPNNNPNITQITANFSSIYLNKGDTLTVHIVAFSTQPNSRMFESVGGITFPVSGTAQLGISNGSLSSAPASPLLTIDYSSILDGSSINYLYFCLKNVTQIDYITSICRLFNLYIEQDPDDIYNLIFLTRDEFYSDTTVLDWSNKIDYDQTIMVTPLPQLQDNTFLYTYRSDSDWWNTQYTNLYGGIYGQLMVAINYDFSTEQLDVLSDSIFSPTPAIQMNQPAQNSESTIEVLIGAENVIQTTGFELYVSGQTGFPSTGGLQKARVGNKILYWGNEYTITYVYNQFQFQVNTNVVRTPGPVNGTYYAESDTFTYLYPNSKIMPCIYQTPDQNITRSPVQVNPRILYYSGLTPTPSGDTWNLSSTPVPANIFSRNNYIYVNPFATGFTEYPFCSNLNDPINPTLDMLFGQPGGIFYTGIYPSTIPNQFSFYWENTLNEILDNEAKMVTANFKLNSLDVANLDLSETIFISGTNYWINQIIDFAADRSISTQVELIRCPYQQINNQAIITPPIANAGPNQTVPLCSGGTYVSASGSTGFVVGYTWSLAFGAAGATIVNPTSETTEFDWSTSGLYILELQVQPGGSTSYVIIDVEQPTANAGSNQSLQLCASNTTLSASGSTGCITGYTWSLLSGPAGSTIVSPNSQTTEFEWAQAGTYDLQLTIQPGGETSDVTVTVSAPTAEASPNQNVDYPATTGLLTASGSTGCITGYTWSQVSGPSTATINSPNSEVTEISNLTETGTYVFEVTVQPGNVVSNTVDIDYTAVTSYTFTMNGSGDSFASAGAACASATGGPSVYSSLPFLGDGAFLYTDSGLTMPFVGNSTYYSITVSGTRYSLTISASGEEESVASC